LNPSDIQWPAAPATLRLVADEIHVWATWLNCAPERLAELSRTLSQSEQARAAKFKFEVHRNRYIVGRGFLRATLGRYLQKDPAMLDFVYSAHDKPELAPGSARDPIHFNLAHSGDLALLAVTRVGAIGVDVECIRPVKDVEDLVTRFFSPRENELFQKLATEEKPGAFFNLWTRKEALLKATGLGIAGGLNRVEVSFLDEEPSRLLFIDGDAAKASQWTLQALAPVRDFVGAVAIQAGNLHLRTWSGL
jgi:4'-phosphopantetheinyl transferase